METVGDHLSVDAAPAAGLHLAADGGVNTDQRRIAPSDLWAFSLHLSLSTRGAINLIGSAVKT